MQKTPPLFASNGGDQLYDKEAEKAYSLNLPEDQANKIVLSGLIKGGRIDKNNEN